MLHIGDIYKHKKMNTFIRILGFASNIKTEYGTDFVIIYEKLNKSEDKTHLVSSYINLGFALQEKDLKQKYKLYVSFKQIGNPIEFEKIEKTILKEMEE